MKTLGEGVLFAAMRECVNVFACFYVFTIAFKAVILWLM